MKKVTGEEKNTGKVYDLCKVNSHEHRMRESYQGFLKKINQSSDDCTDGVVEAADVAGDGAVNVDLVVAVAVVDAVVELGVALGGGGDFGR